MSWVYLDDKFHSNPKVVSAGNAGAGLYAKSLSYCGDHLTDGFVPMPWARVMGSPTLRAKLVDVGLWQEEHGGYRIAGYLELNPSREDVLRKRQERSEAGKKGAAKRWGHDNNHGDSHNTTHRGGYGKSIAKGLGYNQEKGAKMTFDVNDAATRWLNGVGWDEAFDQDAIVEELSRLTRRSGAEGRLDMDSHLALWRKLRHERFGLRGVA